MPVAKAFASSRPSFMFFAHSFCERSYESRPVCASNWRAERGRLRWQVEVRAWVRMPGGGAYLGVYLACAVYGSIRNATHSSTCCQISSPKFQSTWARARR